MSSLRVAVICDLLEENWMSMNLVADMLLQYLESNHVETVSATRLCPPMRRRLTPVPAIVDGRFSVLDRTLNGLKQTAARQFALNASAFNGDRLFNRFWDYPRWLRSRAGQFDLFHVIDHSYAQLVHQLPPERTIVTCHDLDAFRCLLQPDQARRWSPRTTIAKRVLAGLRKAALVTCDSAAIREELLSYKLLPQDRVVVVPIGVHPTCSPEPDTLADREAAELLGAAHPEQINLLHVSSTVPRKRLDVLLKVFAGVRVEFPQARLIRVGGQFTAAQEELAGQLNLTDAIVVLPFIEREVLAAVYRRATLVLQPSEREGFGLPVIEAMACGTPVIASEIAVLREVAGDAATYCPVGDVNAWRGAVVQILNERCQQPAQWAQRQAAGLAQAAKYTWAGFAKSMVELYLEVNRKGIR